MELGRQHIAIFLITFLSTLAAVAIVSFSLPKGNIPQVPTGDEIDIAAAYWRDIARPIGIVKMERSNDTLSVTLANREGRNITLRRLALSENTASLDLEFGPYEDRVQMFRSREPCAAGELRIYQVSYQYSDAGQEGQFSGAKPYIVRCG